MEIYLRVEKVEKEIVAIAKVFGRGRIQIPAEVRVRLNLKDGAEVLFIEEDGRVFIANKKNVRVLQFKMA